MRLLALCLAAIAVASAADRRAAPRSERRDQGRPHGTTSAVAPRNSVARREFQRIHPCPANQKTSGPCPGYVVDHIVALKRGGSDTPDNMQWQTVAEAKAKDKVE